jgi:hypothetical protein
MPALLVRDHLGPADLAAAHAPSAGLIAADELGLG